MNAPPQFSLRWNNYVSHVTGAFNVLRLDNDLVDVTLCCEGGQIKAHRVLLSACSSYFKQIFKENPCQHPVIIFKNVKFDDLNAIVNFMYHGEINIFQEQLESFLITAELLQIKGLTDNAEDQSYTKVSDSISLDLSAKGKTNEQPLPTTSDAPINLATAQNIAGEVKLNYNPSVSHADVKGQGDSTIETSEPNEMQNQNKAIHQSTEEDMNVDSQGSTIEDLSDRNTNDSDLLKFWCQLCPKGFKHPTSLTLHKDSHAGKTQCPVCYRSFSRSYDMRSHLQRIHQGKQLTIKEIRYKSTSDSVSTKPFTHNV